MSLTIISGGLIGSFLHLVLKDGVVKEGEIKAWQNWFISLLAGIVSYGAYYIFTNIGLIPYANSFLSELGVGAFIGYTLDSLAKKVYHKKSI
ncbi:hypothetical protein CMO93_03885 [Candidatus Woesearchaeota archaeon]|nr:hypothetical protein [Candidatus Woesearchaeota archaeon]|tara:strand:- start:1422 stop:1697 length:276 start_codon:yes stop_codon:yes gene_type:complete